MRTLIGKSKAAVVIVSSLRRGESCRVAVTLRSSGPAAAAAGAAEATSARSKNVAISRGRIGAELYESRCGGEPRRSGDPARDGGGRGGEHGARPPGQAERHVARDAAGA